MKTETQIPTIEVPEGYSITDFVKLVSTYLDKNYGSHLFERFQQEIKDNLQKLDNK